MEKRPIIKIELTNGDKAVEITGWLLLAGLWTLTGLNYSGLPDEIPVHYNGLGQPDNYDSKSGIWMLPVIGTILFIGMTVLNRSPHIFKYPGKITTINAKQQYTSATRLIRFLKVAVVMIFVVIVFKTIQTALGQAAGMGNMFLPFALLLLFLPLVIFLSSNKKKDRV
ncbi:DUF1648 domain-containing protein [Segetibacter sp. 3557_3]|uniref:DUF1648 domain-containing protein n=1 Tax=Segetibacter sp. 3557_3 TaxID=2547429 RepID=UPI0010586ED5|nr:DUF1648 domain-containing protein [Segetibacter sp. 3557_3]TDH28607.1 DUF1648 domain-containing protein [Segetibacter sp. 3557_3]